MLSSSHRGDRTPLNQVYLTSTPTALFSLLLSALILLAACGSPPPPVETATQTAPEITPATSTKTATTPASTATISPTPTYTLNVSPSALNGVQITFWHPWAGESGAAIQESIDQFNGSNEFGISVLSLYQGNINILNDLIAEPEAVGGHPNLSLGSSSQIAAWVAQGKPVVDLNPYLNDPHWGLSPVDQADFSPLFLAQDTSGQNRIGFPAARSAQLMFYNTTWAQDLGFSSPPRTPEEFLEQACAAARSVAADEDAAATGRGGWLINNTPSAVLNWLYAFGSPVVLPDGDGYQFADDQSEAALLFLKELFDQGCAWEVIESTPEVEFAGRKALFVTSSLTDLAYQYAELQHVGNTDEWTVIGFPSPLAEPAISVFGPSFVMFAGSPAENLAAWLLIEWLTSPVQQAEFIMAHGSFPTRDSAVDHLAEFADDNPQWAAAQDLLVGAQPEPNLASWNVVRWVLADVGTQVFRYYFEPERIPATLELMDETAAELHERSQ